MIAYDDWETAFADDVELTERPLWDDRTGPLVWVDCYGGVVHRLGEDGGTECSRPARARCGGAARERRAGGRARRRRLLFIGPDGEPDRDEILFHLPANVRFNDGACDPAGRFLIGTCSTDGSRGQGALYSVEPDGSVTGCSPAITESNGLAWSARRGDLYYVDSGEPEILRAYPYDVTTGRLGIAATLVALRCRGGCRRRADRRRRRRDLGGDVGGIGGAPDLAGRRDPAHPDMPVSRPTCPAFGGPGLDLLYVTTAWEGMEAQERAREPLAGSLLVTSPGVRGVPAARFAG